MFALEHFRVYLLGRKFRLRTDHRALAWLFYEGPESFCPHFRLARDADRVPDCYRVRLWIRIQYRRCPLASRFSGCRQRGARLSRETCPVLFLPCHAS